MILAYSGLYSGPVFDPAVVVQGAYARYWPVLLAVAVYVGTFAASLPLRDAGTIRRVVLAAGPTCCVYLWGILTVCTLVRDDLDFPHPANVAVESVLCLFVILILLVPRNLVSRRIRMPTAFTLGASATIAAVYSDLLFIFVLMTPWER